MTKSPGAKDMKGIRRPFYNHIVEFILDDFGMSRFAPIGVFCDRESCSVRKCFIKLCVNGSNALKEEDLIAGSYYFIDKKETTAFQQKLHVLVRMVKFDSFDEAENKGEMKYSNIFQS